MHYSKTAKGELWDGKVALYNKILSFLLNTSIWGLVSYLEKAHIYLKFDCSQLSQ